MTKRSDFIVTIALLCAEALLLSASVQATSATSTISVTVISPAEMATVAAAELLQSASPGVLTLSIPGAGASCVDSVGAGASCVDSVGAGGGMTLTSSGVIGNTIIFSTADSATLASLLETLAASGGSLGTKGILSAGQGVSLFVTRAERYGNGKGRMSAIVAYN